MVFEHTLSCARQEACECVAFSDESPSLKFWQILTKFPEAFPLRHIVGGSSLSKQEAAVLNFFQRRYFGLLPRLLSICLKQAWKLQIICMRAACHCFCIWLLSGRIAWIQNEWQNHYFCNSCLLENEAMAMKQNTVSTWSNIKGHCFWPNINNIAYISAGEAINRHQASVPRRSANVIGEK